MLERGAALEGDADVVARGDLDVVAPGDLDLVAALDAIGEVVGGAATVPAGVAVPADEGAGGGEKSPGARHSVPGRTAPLQSTCRRPM